MSWFAVRCVFRWSGDDGPYEERITLWEAAGFDEAISLAEREAAEYADDTGVRYLHLAQCYHLAVDRPGSGDEVFSLLRDSSLPPEEYVSTFFSTGDERQGTL